jgi:Acetyltransferase (GNAT) family
MFMRNAFYWAVAFSNKLLSLQGKLSSSVEEVSNQIELLENNSKINLLPFVRYRVAESSDAKHIFRMINELALFEREPESVITNEQILLRDGFGSAPIIHTILAEVPIEIAKLYYKQAEANQASSGSSSDEKYNRTMIPPEFIQSNTDKSSTNSSQVSGDYFPIAMSCCFVAYSTWEGRMLYVEDLYVCPPFRHLGISTNLLCFTARAAFASDCARLQWTALDWNVNAINFYVGPKVNAVELSEWKLYRVYRKQIGSLAGNITDVPN